MKQKKTMIQVRDVSMRFRLTDDRIMSLKEFVTRTVSGKIQHKDSGP